MPYRLHVLSEFVVWLGPGLPNIVSLPSSLTDFFLTKAGLIILPQI
jgi:hypothetical protein